MDDIIRLARPDIVALSPYSSARVEGEQKNMSVYLDANESPYPPFPGTADVVGLNRYPEPQPLHLLERFAALYNVPVERLFFSRGANEAIDLLVRVFCAAGSDGILIAPPAFAMYAVSAEIQGAAIFEVPLLAESGFQLDVPAMLALRHKHPSIKLVFVTSPNNPTSNLLRRADVLRLADELRGMAIVVADQTYVEYSGEPPLSAEIATHPNLVVLRTLSKEYGLCGERFGITVAEPSVIGLLRRVMAPYSLTQTAIRAVTEAMSDEGLAYARHNRTILLEERRRLETAFAESPAVRRVLPSDTNFLIVETAQPALLIEMMAAAGIKIRDRSRAPGLEGCIRISPGTPTQNDAMLAVFERYAHSVAAAIGT